MVFYMIMNKLYYVVGLILLLLFALMREDLENISVRAKILSHRQRTYISIQRRDIPNYKMTICLLQSNNSYHIANRASLHKYV